MLVVTDRTGNPRIWGIASGRRNDTDALGYTFSSESVHRFIILLATDTRRCRDLQELQIVSVPKLGYLNDLASLREADRRVDLVGDLGVGVGEVRYRREAAASRDAGNVLG